MDWELEIKNRSFLPEKGKPTEETVCYKIDGTSYEMSTSRGRLGTAPRQAEYG